MSAKIANPSVEEYHRLTARAERYLKFALGRIPTSATAKKHFDKKVHSLVFMVEGERQRAVREYRLGIYEVGPELLVKDPADAKRLSDFLEPKPGFFNTLKRMFLR